MRACLYGCAAENVGNIESLLAFAKSFDNNGWFRTNRAAFDCAGLQDLHTNSMPLCWRMLELNGQHLQTRFGIYLGYL